MADLTKLKAEITDSLARVQAELDAGKISAENVQNTLSGLMGGQRKLEKVKQELVSLQEVIAEVERQNP